MERSTDSIEYVVRDLGPARENAQHEIRLGSRVFWAIDWDQDAHLLLLDESPEDKIYCLCPSWFCPNTGIEPGVTLLPPKEAHCEPFVVTGHPGREHILAILSTKPLAEHWMPDDRETPSRVLSSSDIVELTERIRQLDVGTWTALATYCDITV